NNTLFLQNEVATIKIQMDSQDLESMLTSESSDLEFPAQFIYNSSTNNDTILNIGFGLRGNTSLAAAKKSFKVSFNHIIPGEKYKGLEKLNLNGEHNDVSIMRSKINNEMLMDLDLLAARASYVKLYVNDEYKGLYLIMEPIDDEFIQKRFPNFDNGNLFKCSWGANLMYWGANPSNYSSVYELKTNEDSSNYSGLIHFLDVLNNTNDSEFPCAIESVFNVYPYLKTAAFEILIGHWDGYIFNNNNFFLYENPQDGRFVFMEYDMDNTLGVDWFNVDWSTRNINYWISNNERPLFNRLMAVPYYKEVFNIYLEQILDSVFSAQYLLPRLNEIQDLITEATLLDTYRTLDYGFTENDFLNSITSAWGNHIPISLQDYLTQRENSARNQIQHQNAVAPCLNAITKLDLPKKEIVRVINTLGQEIDFKSKNVVKIIQFTDGTSVKQIDFE
ncbi:MAG: CotH kinase family protein, partial [Flavobacteriia bacterium]